VETEKMKTQCAMILVLGLVATWFACACAPSPESYASATATLMRAANLATQDAQMNDDIATAKAGEAYATATAVAIAAQATHTAIAWQARATETDWQVRVDATATAVPHNAALVATRAQTTQAFDWLGVLTGWVLLVLVIAMASSLHLLIRHRVMQIPRNAAGQLPMVYREGVLIDPARMIGPALMMPRHPGLLWNLRRLMGYARTGQLEALPAPQFTLTDANASADQLLAAAQSAQMTAGIAAMFQPGMANVERQDRLRVAEHATQQNLPLVPPPPSVPTPRVIVQGNDAIETIARVMGDRLPTLDVSDSEAPLTLSNPGEPGNAA
jgi:hypothetical protein